MATREILQRPLDAAGNQVTGLPTATQPSDAVPLSQMLAAIPGTITSLTGDVTAAGTGAVPATLANLPQAVLFARLSALSADPAFNAHKLTNVADGTAAQDVATLHQLTDRLAEFDGIATGAAQLSAFVPPTTGMVLARVKPPVDDFFCLSRSSTATADGITVVNVAGGGGGRWIRMRIGSALAAQQAAWFIDPNNASGTASDENTGIDATHQLRTRSESYRRLGTARITIPMGWTIADSLVAGDIERASFRGDQLIAKISYTGVRRVLFTGTITSVVNRNGSTGTHTSMVINGLPGTWTTGDGITSFLGMVVRDNATGACARVVADEGGKQAWLSAPLNHSNSLEVTFTPGNTVIIYDVPSLGTNESVYETATYTDLKVNGGRFNVIDGAIAALNDCSGDTIVSGGSCFYSNGVSGLVGAQAALVQNGNLTLEGGYHRVVEGGGAFVRVNVATTLKALQIESGSTGLGIVQQTSPPSSQITADLEFNGNIALDAIVMLLSGGRLHVAGFVYGVVAGPSFIQFGAQGSTINFAHAPNLTGTNSQLVKFNLAATTASIAALSSGSIVDIYGNRIDGPLGPTWPDNRSQPIANLGSGGTTPTNAANIGDVQNSAFGVANKAALIAINTTSMAAGVQRYVVTYRRWFTLRKGATLTPIDGESFAPTTGAVGDFWLWDGSVDPSWVTQTAFTINPAGGDDESATTLKTLSEFARRTDRQWAPAPITVTITGSLNAGDIRKPLIYGHFTTPVATVNYVGVPISLGTFTLSGCVARNGAGSQFTTATSTWTPASLIGKLVEWTDGSGHFVRAIIVSDRGGGVAWLSPPLNESSAETVFANGQTVTVYDYPSLGEHIIRGGANTFAYLNATHWHSLEGRTDLAQCSGTVHGWGGGVGLVNCFSPIGSDDGNHNHTFFAGTTCNVGGGFNGFILGRGTFLRISVSTTISRLQIEQSWLTGAALGATYNDVEFCSTNNSGVIDAIGVPGGGGSFQGFVYGESSTVKPAILCEGRDVVFGFSHVPNITNATTVSFTQAGTSFPVSLLATQQLNDTFNNTVVGPGGPTLNDNASQPIAHLGSGGATGTNAANIADATAIAAAAVAGIPASVPLAGHAGFSLLGKATTGTGNDADIPVGTDSVTGRIGSGNVGDIPMTAAGRAMAGAASATAQTALLDVFGTAKGLVPGVISDTTKFLRADGSFAVPPGTGGGSVSSLTGDVTGTGPGATATTIANDAVTNAKAANMAAHTFKANNTGASGDPIDITGTQATAELDVFTASLKGLVPAGTGAAGTFLAPDGTWKVPSGTGGGGPLTGLSGDVTTTGGGVAPATISADAVTFAKMQNIPTDTLVGRDTAGTGDPESITVGGGIEFTGTGGIQRSALTGDVSASAGSAGTVINTGVVTNAQLATVPTGTLKGRTAAGTGAPSDLTLAVVKAALAISFADISGTLLAAQFPALTGDVTTPGGSLATTLATTGVTAGTYGDGSHVAQVTVDAKGRVTAASSPSISIAAGAVSGLAAIATSGSGADLVVNTVSDAKLRQGAATSVIGRAGGTTGNVADITATVDDRVLGRRSGALGYFQVDNPMIASGAVGLNKHQSFPPQTMLGNDTGATTDPNWMTKAAVRTFLGLDATQSLDLFLAFGINDGMNLDSIPPGSSGTGHWPFWLQHKTISGDVSINGYIGAAVDANLNNPAVKTEFMCDAVFTHCYITARVETWDPQSVSGTPLITLALSQNGLCDSSPFTVALPGVGQWGGGLNACSFGFGDVVGVRAFPNSSWGNGGGVPHVKFTVHARLTP